ncbi:AAA family ATPase [Bacillus sp. CGMCC 1.16541]|uniref:AAA family ATPase n=1 Tax=Bacillus sp. CGMCC 1.16541 TaxID=2185143 RepID=UPI0013A59812|nr:AAA family ATPase [Bacillus sp. CGMCC 1.16541]
MVQVKKVKSVHREGWCLAFSHPVKGHVKRWMNTNDEQEIERLALEMTELLRDEEAGVIQARPRINARYDSRVVEAFYEDIFTSSPAVVRDEYVSLPPINQRQHVLIVGEKGAGKTSLIRRLLHLKQEEKFPSTATVNPFRPSVEYVCTTQPTYEVVVVFEQRKHVKAKLNTQLAHAAYEYAAGGTDQELLYALFHELHTSLSYVCGTLAVTLPYTNQSLPGRTSIPNKLLELVETIQTEALRLKESLTEQEWKSCFFDAWREQPTCQQLLEEVMTQIEEMMVLVQTGTWTFTDDDWPLAWTFQTEKKIECFSYLERFTTHVKDKYEGLLSPFVESIRLKGAFIDQVEDLVISEHSSKEVTLQELKQSDKVVVVHDMTTTLPCELIETLVIHGQAHKLLFCFTHEDKLYGGTKSQRASYVTARLKEVFTFIEQNLGSHAKDTAERSVSQNGVFVFKSLHSYVDDPHTIALCGMLLEAIQQPRVALEEDVTPLYINMMIPLAVDRGVTDFYKCWDETSLDQHTLAHLCQTMSQPHAQCEVGKAFCRSMQKHVYTLFFAQPSGWSRPDVTQDRKEAALERLTERFCEKIQTYADEQLHHPKQWRKACAASSHAERVKLVQSFIREALPTPTDDTYPQLLKRVYRLVKETVEEEEGILLS